MFRARSLCLFFLVIFFSFQISEGLCQIKYAISKEMYERCEKAIVVYVGKARNWDKGAYEINFDSIDESRNTAAFGVTNKAYLEELESRKHTIKGGVFNHNPDQDFIVLVDIVDYVVLSEGDINTYFPNAKPGYERAVPRKPKE